MSNYIEKDTDVKKMINSDIWILSDIRVRHTM